MKAVTLIGLGIATFMQFAVSYLFITMMSVGWDDWYIKIGFGISIATCVYFFSKFVGTIGWLDEDEEEVDEKKPPLYYKITQINGEFYFTIKSQNHEVICSSDSFATMDGCITGLWYLMNSMKQMNELAWKTEHSN